MLKIASVKKSYRMTSSQNTAKNAVKSNYCSFSMRFVLRPVSGKPCCFAIFSAIKYSNINDL